MQWHSSCLNWAGELMIRIPVHLDHVGSMRDWDLAAYWI